MMRLQAEDVRSIMLSILERSLPPGTVPAPVPDAFNLVAEGVVDSLGFLELIGELERRLGAPIDLGDMDPDHLAAIGPLSRYIAQTRSQ